MVFILQMGQFGIRKHIMSKIMGDLKYKCNLNLNPLIGYLNLNKIVFGKYLRVSVISRKFFFFLFENFVSHNEPWWVCWTHGCMLDLARTWAVLIWMNWLAVEPFCLSCSSTMQSFAQSKRSFASNRYNCALWNHSNGLLHIWQGSRTVECISSRFHAIWNRCLYHRLVPILHNSKSWNHEKLTRLDVRLCWSIFIYLFLFIWFVQWQTW